MNEGQNGRIKINDGDWIDANIEMDISPLDISGQDHLFDLNEMLRKMREPITMEGTIPFDGLIEMKQWSTGAKIEGTLTSHGVELFRGMFQEWARPEPWMFLVSQEMMWRIQYAKQGKHYPSPRKRKSKAWRERISRKMRRV